MSIKVTFEFENAADAAAFLQDFDSPAAEAGAQPGKRGRGRPPKDAGSAAAPAAAPAAAASAAPAQSAAAPAATASAAAVPFKAVADAITELAEKDRDKAVALLAKYGAKLASELKPEQFAGIVADAKAAMAAAPTSLI